MATAIGGCDTDTGARKQRHAQFFLQFLDGARQRRLLDMQSLGRAGEVQFFGHGQETAKMAQFHIAASSCA
ncbi:hypothetical protein AAA612_04070 [Pseudomonas aeruginosa]